MKGACQLALTSSFGKGRRGQSSLLENPPVSLWRSFLWRYSFLQRGIQISGPERDGRGVEPGCRLKVAWGCLHLTELCVSRSPLCPWPSYLESQWFAIIESKPPFWGGGRHRAVQPLCLGAGGGVRLRAPPQSAHCEATSFAAWGVPCAAVWYSSFCSFADTHSVSSTSLSTLHASWVLLSRIIRPFQFILAPIFVTPFLMGFCEKEKNSCVQSNQKSLTPSYRLFSKIHSSRCVPPDHVEHRKGGILLPKEVSWQGNPIFPSEKGFPSWEKYSAGAIIGL